MTALLIDLRGPFVVARFAADRLQHLLRVVVDFQDAVFSPSKRYLWPAK
jgi:hypothetical protein